MEETRLATAMVAQMGLDYSDVEKSSKNAAKVFSDLKADIERIGASMDAATAKGADLETVSKNVAKAGDMIARAWETAEQMNGRVNASVKRLNDEYAALGKVASEAMLKGTKEGDAQMRAAQSRMQAIRQEIAQYDAVQQGMEEVTAELSRQEDAYTQIKMKIDTATGASMSMRQQLRQVTEQMYAMRAAALESGGQAAVKAVMASDAYQQLAEKAASLRDIQRDVNAEMTTMANDNGTLKAVITGVQGVAGAFGVAQGAIGLFAGESAELQKVMTKVQSLMAVMMGLQQVVNTLNKDSALMTSLRRWAVGFQATGTAATGAAAKIKLLWAAMKANPAGLIIAALTAVAVAVSKLIKRNSEALELQKKLNEEARENIRLINEQNNVITSSGNKRVERLQREMNLLVAQDAPLSERVKKEREILTLKRDIAKETYDNARQIGSEKAVNDVLQSRIKRMEKLQSMSAEKVTVNGKRYDRTAIKKQTQDDIDRYTEQLEAIRKAQREYRNAANDLAVFEAEQATNRHKAAKQRADEKAKQDRQDFEAWKKQMDEEKEAMKKEAEERRKIEERVFAENRSFTDRRLDLDREYAAARAVITAAQIQDEEVRARTLEQLRRNYIDAQKRLLQEELDDIRRQAEEKYQASMDAAESITDEQEREKAIRAVNLDILKDEKAVLSALVAMGRKDLLPQLKEVAKQLDKIESGTAVIEEGWRERLNKAVMDTLSHFSEVVDAIGEAASAMQELGAVSEDVSGTVEDMAGIFKSVASGLQSGGIFGAISGGLTSMLSYIANYRKKLKEELNEINRAYDEHQSRLLSAKQKIAQSGAFGGTDMSLSAMNSYGNNGFSGGSYRYSGGSVRRARVGGTPTNNYQSQIDFEYEKLNAYRKLWNDLKQETRDGLFDTEASEVFKEYFYQTLAEISEYYSSFFGQIANDITKAMTAPADSIDEAFSNAYDNISGYVRSWIANMLYGQRIQKFMADEQAKINAAIGEGNQEAVKKQIQSSLQAISEFLRTLKLEKEANAEFERQMLEEYGFGETYTSASSRTGATKGIAQASQESVTELNGRMTAVQAYTFRLAENSDIITGNVAAILGSVRNIDRSTSVTMEHVRYMRTSLDDIVTNGVKMRN